MNLNIKDPETHKLAQLLAKETGETMTAAVTQAIRDRLDGVRDERKQQAKLAALLDIGRRGAARFEGLRSTTLSFSMARMASPSDLGLVRDAGYGIR